MIKTRDILQKINCPHLSLIKNTTNQYFYWVYDDPVNNIYETESIYTAYLYRHSLKGWVNLGNEFVKKVTKERIIMDITVIYQAKNYDPKLVTGRYVRCHGRKPNYTFRVFETVTGTGVFEGKPGHGPTIREYDCDGSALSPTLRDKCIKSKVMELWDNPTI